MRRFLSILLCAAAALSLVTGGTAAAASRADAGRLSDVVQITRPSANANDDQGERRLTEDELRALSDSITVKEDGFFLSTYDRPEEIDWHQVFYNGASISVDPTEAQYEAWESRYGELYTSLTIIPVSAVEEFVLDMTATSYALARKPLSLSWLLIDDDTMYCHAHGDTNYEPISFTDGYADGDLYRLYYTRSDWQEYSESREFVVTAYIRNGAWQFVSNLPADAPAPVTLLSIEFCASPEDIADPGSLTDTIEVEPTSYSEPYEWGWAVITAQEDNVRYIIERVSSPFDYSDGEAIIPGDAIASGVLDRGESVALYVNRPWHPEVRVTASSGNYWGSYIFGEDNGLYLNDSAGRYVTGHDLAGEGRGCEPADQAELARFLTDGAWIYRDPDTLEVLAAVDFSNFWQMEITTVDAAYPIYLSYSHLYADEDMAPDLMLLERAYYHETDWSALPSWYTSDAFGDYIVSALQLDGEQLLYLSQANNGEGALGYLFPEAGENEHEFMLIRYQGTLEMEGQG